jgi:tetratricopeptide (TPR) repeat protein
VRRSWIGLVLGIAAVSILVLGACSREPASLKELATERALADSLVRGFTPTSQESLARTVIAARARTKTFLTKHKNDVPAALIYVKLRLAEEALTPQSAQTDSAGMPLDHFARAAASKARVTDCLEALDVAIKRDPKNAELYYWKSLVHGLFEPIFDKHALDPKRSQLPQALEAAGKAVSLAPDSNSYRTALATYQMLTGDDAAALRTLRAGKKKNTPMERLLAEWERFPVPPNAVLSMRESAGIAEWMTASGLDDANARVRAYWIPGSQDELRAFYARTWKDLYWMTQKQRQPNGEDWAFGSAAVIFSGDGYHPVNEKEIKNAALAQAEGISIQIREVRNPQATSRMAIPFEPGPVVCEMLLTNHRRVR